MFIKLSSGYDSFRALGTRIAGSADSTSFPTGKFQIPFAKQVYKAGQ